MAVLVVDKVGVIVDNDNGVVAAIVMMIMMSSLFML